MKIAILGPAPPFRGGISRFALSLARAFKDTGHNVQFFNFREQYPKLLFLERDNMIQNFLPMNLLIIKFLPPGYLKHGKQPFTSSKYIDPRQLLSPGFYPILHLLMAIFYDK